MVNIQNYIGGELMPPVNGRRIDNYEPATGMVFGTIPDSDQDDIKLAVEVAKKAFPAWAATSLDQKYEILARIAQGISARLETLAGAESRDNGKPLWLAKQVDIPRAAANFEFFATGLKHFHSEAYFNPPYTFSTILRQPIGIVGCISPWNLPLYLFTWKIAPAIAAGNCVIAKPSEVTPYSAYLLAEICQEAGLPPGVLNIVHGTGPSAGSAIVAHPDIKAISFTGGTATGASIAREAAPVFKKLSLELGGKNAAIIMDDCNYDLMLREVIRSSFSNQGQICLCTSRLLIHDNIYERFKADFTATVNALTIGDPLEAGNNQGAIVSFDHLNKIEKAVERAKTEGGTILTGGERIHPSGRCQDGYFFRPTIIEGLGPETMTNMEEIFGPVVTLQRFASVDEAISLANHSQYGLASVIWSNHTHTIHQLSNAVQAGIVWVNCWLVRDLRTPFGGVNNSGVGREGGWEAMRFFTEAKSITEFVKH